MAYHDDEEDPLVPDVAPMPANQFAAALSGEPIPGEAPESFWQRREKLAGLGVLGPERLASNDREREQQQRDANAARDDAQRGMEAQAKQQQQDAEAAARAQAATARTAAIEQRRLQGEQAKAAKAAETAQKRFLKSQGVEFDVGPDGNEFAQQHPDGRLKFKKGFTEDPYQDETGRWVRDYRDEFGEPKPMDLEQQGDIHTDAETGMRYFKDAGGLRVDVGPDVSYQERAALRAEITQRQNENSQRNAEIAQRRLEMQPVKDAFDVVAKDAKPAQKRLKDVEGSIAQLKSITATVPPELEAQRKAAADAWELVKPGFEASQKEYDAAEGDIRKRQLESNAMAQETLRKSARLNELKSSRGQGPRPAGGLDTQLEATRTGIMDEAKAAQDEHAKALDTFKALQKQAEFRPELAARLPDLEARVRESADKVRSAGWKANAFGSLIAEASAAADAMEAAHAAAVPALSELTRQRQIAFAEAALNPSATGDWQARQRQFEAAQAAALAPVTTAREAAQAAAQKVVTTFATPGAWKVDPKAGVATADVQALADEIATRFDIPHTQAAALVLDSAAAAANFMDGRPLAGAKSKVQDAATWAPFLSPEIKASFDVQRSVQDGVDAKRNLGSVAANLVATREAGKQFGSLHYGAAWKDIFGNGAPSGQHTELQMILDRQRAQRERLSKIDASDSPAKGVLKFIDVFGNAVGGGANVIMRAVLGRSAADEKRKLDAQAAGQLIGQLDADGVEKMLPMLPRLGEQWEKTRSVLTPEQEASAATEKKAADAWFSADDSERVNRLRGGGKTGGGMTLWSRNLTLYGAQELAKRLESGKGGQTAATFDALLSGLIGTNGGQIEINENDPQQVAQRVFLSERLADAVTKNAHWKTTIAQGGASMASFMGTGMLGRMIGIKAAGGLGAMNKAASAVEAAQIAGTAQRIGSLVTGGLYGADIDFKAMPGNVGFGNRLLSIAGEGASLMLSERIGDVAGRKLQQRLASMGKGAKAQAAGKFAGRAFGQGGGEMASSQIQNVMQGRNPFDGIAESFLTEGLGIGLGGALLGLVWDRMTKGAGGRARAGRWQAGHDALKAAREAMDATKDIADPAERFARETAAKESIGIAEKNLEAETLNVLKVSPATSRNLGNLLGAESRSFPTALSENPILRAAAVGMGEEGRETYLPGNKSLAAANILAAEPGFDAESSGLAEAAVNQHVGVAMARDLGALAEGKTLTPEKVVLFDKLGLAQVGEDGAVTITEQAIPLLPTAQRQAIAKAPENFKVTIQPGAPISLALNLADRGHSRISSAVERITTVAGQAVADAVARQQQTQGGVSVTSKTHTLGTEGSIPSPATNAKPVEQMTPEEFDARKAALEEPLLNEAKEKAQAEGRDPGKVSVSTQSERGDLVAAIESGRPLNAALLDRYNASSERKITLAEGWTQSGGLWHPPGARTSGKWKVAIGRLDDGRAHSHTWTIAAATQEAAVAKGMQRIRNLPGTITSATAVDISAPAAEDGADEGRPSESGTADRAGQEQAGASPGEGGRAGTGTADESTGQGARDAAEPGSAGRGTGGGAGAEPVRVPDAGTVHRPRGIVARLQAHGVEVREGRDPSAQFMPDGRVVLTLAQDKPWREQFREEGIHLGAILAGRDRWIAAGKPAAFNAWLKAEGRDVFDDLRNQYAAIPDGQEKEVIRRGIVGAFNLYSADLRGDTPRATTPEAVFDALLRGESAGWNKEVTMEGWNFAFELARMLSNARKGGHLSETTLRAFLGKISDWLRSALAAVRDLAFAARKRGSMIEATQLMAMVRGAEAKLGSVLGAKLEIAEGMDITPAPAAAPPPAAAPTAAPREAAAESEASTERVASEQPVPAAGAGGEKKAAKTFRRKARDLPPAPGGGEDVIDHLLNNVGKLRTVQTAMDRAMKQRGHVLGIDERNFMRAARKRIGGAYDAVSELPTRLRAGIFAARGTGITPDEAAQMLADANLIDDAHPDTMWEAVRGAYQSRLTAEAERGDLERQQKENDAQAREFKEDATQREPGEELIRPAEGNVQVGDVVEIGGEKMKVIAADADSVTLEDGDKYGIQEVYDGDEVWGKIEPAPDREQAGEGAVFARREDPAQRELGGDVAAAGLPLFSGARSDERGVMSGKPAVAAPKPPTPNPQPFSRHASELAGDARGLADGVSGKAPLPFLRGLQEDASVLGTVGQRMLAALDKLRERMNGDIMQRNLEMKAGGDLFGASGGSKLDAMNTKIARDAATAAQVLGKLAEIQGQQQSILLARREGGYRDDFSKSNRAANAEADGRFPASEIARRLGVPVGFIKEHAPHGGEWHHTSKFYNAVNYYNLAEVEHWIKGEGDYAPAGDEPSGGDLLAEYRVKQKALKANAPDVLHGQTIKFLQWGGTRNHPRATEHTLENVSIERKPGQKQVTITTEDGKTFRKSLDSRGFEIAYLDGRFSSADSVFNGAVDRMKNTLPWPELPAGYSVRRFPHPSNDEFTTYIVNDSIGRAPYPSEDIGAKSPAEAVLRFEAMRAGWTSGSSNSPGLQRSGQARREWLAAKEGRKAFDWNDPASPKSYGQLQDAEDAARRLVIELNTPELEEEKLADMATFLSRKKAIAAPLAESGDAGFKTEPTAENQQDMRGSGREGLAASKARSEYPQGAGGGNKNVSPDSTLFARREEAASVPVEQLTALELDMEAERLGIPLRTEQVKGLLNGDAAAVAHVRERVRQKREEGGQLFARGEGRDWDLLAEDLRDNLDSFNPARDTGRRNYDLDDMVDRFVEYAKADISGAPLSRLASEFAKTDEASTAQLRKLHAAIKSINPDSPGILYARPAEDFGRIDAITAAIAAPVEPKLDTHPAGVSGWMRDAYTRLLRGRKDVLEHFAPGTKDAIEDGEFSAARAQAGLREMMERMLGHVKTALGATKDADGKLRRKQFVAELLPTAAHLNATGYDADNAFLFEDFEMRAGGLAKRLADKAGLGTGDTVTRGAETLKIGNYIEPLKEYQLLRTVTAGQQQAIHQRFTQRYPEVAHYLDLWIAPDSADARVTDARGTVLPEFNRFALRKFFGEVSPHGELGDVAAYVPEVQRTKTLAGAIAGAVQNLLNKNFKSGAREYKSGAARESGNVKNLFEGFGIRAMEAHAERQRLETAEKLLPLALRDIPPDGLPLTGWMAVNEHALPRMVDAYAGAQGMDAQQLMNLTRAVSAATSSIDMLPATLADMVRLTQHLQTRNARDISQHLSRLGIALAMERTAPATGESDADNVKDILKQLSTALEEASLELPHELQAQMEAAEAIRKRNLAEQLSRLHAAILAGGETKEITLPDGRKAKMHANEDALEALTGLGAALAANRGLPNETAAAIESAKAARARAIFEQMQRLQKALTRKRTAGFTMPHGAKAEESNPEALTAFQQLSTAMLQDRRELPTGLLERLEAVKAAIFAAKEGQKELKRIVGSAWAQLASGKKMIRKEIFSELVRPMADRQVRNVYVAAADKMIKSYVAGLLSHPFSWIQNQVSNELFKTMRAAQRALYAVAVRRTDRTESKVAASESWELVKGMVTNRWWNQKRIDDVVPPEMFEGNTSISGAARTITEERMTAMEHLKQGNVPQALLTAARYQQMDVRTKQQLAYASYVARASVAADEAEAKGFRFSKAQRAQWMRDWLNNAPDTVHREAYTVAVAYAMDYSNVPWWADPDSRVMAGQTDITGAVNILRRLTLPFVKWPYNMARQIKRFGVDSATDTFTYLAGKALTAIPGIRDTAAADWARGHASAKGVPALTPRLANSLAHLGTFAMMLGILRAAMMSGKGDDKDELDRLGRSFDQAGKRLDRQFDTSSRVNISDVPVLGASVRALAKMFGDEKGEPDFWLRVRTIPYMSPMLAMAAAGSALTADAQHAPGEREQAWSSFREFVADFNSEGALLTMFNKITGKDSKYTASQPVGVTLGGTLFDIVTARIAPPPLLKAVTDMVDPQMRRLSPSPSIGYDPGVLQGVTAKIPGLSRTLPPSGEVRTRTIANAAMDVARLQGAGERKADRVRLNDEGRPVWSYVDPDELAKVPRWRTMLRFAGMNVKPVPREAYRRAVAGTEGSFQRMLRKTSK